MMNIKRSFSVKKMNALLIFFTICIVLASAASVSVYAHNATTFENHIPGVQRIARGDIIARAQAWVKAGVPYNQRGRYQGYREDCSGFASMAWGLPTPGLVTYTFPTVSQQISKDELQPGDILLNQYGGGNPDFAHVVIFASWVDASHTRYNAYEEVPDWGGAHYTTNMPYPYWPGYDTSEYVPMRLKSLANLPPSPSVPSTPIAISRGPNTMAVFYNDGNNHLVNWSWDASYGWSWQEWADDINGQPTAVARTSDSMDVFYRTAEGKLVNRGWNSTNGWSGPNVLLSSGVAGDPAVVARDSGKMQVFFLTSAGEIKSVAWDWRSGWNLNPQLLYGPGATSDPVAISRTPDSMDVFFGKNNGNLVHLGWTAAYGWNTTDWTVGSALTGRPTAVIRNNGGDMSCFYQETNGYVAERNWDWQLSWGWQDWQAQLVGSPSAISRTSSNMDVFYRETGGNIVDRYWAGTTWATTNIVNAGNATGNPYALVRGSNMEVFYWNNSTLMAAHWDAVNGWSTAPVH